MVKFSISLFVVVCGFNCRAYNPHLVLLAGNDDTIHFILHGLDVLFDRVQVELEAGKLSPVVLHFGLHQTG